MSRSTVGIVKAINPVVSLVAHRRVFLVMTKTKTKTSKADFTEFIYHVQPDDRTGWAWDAIFEDYPERRDQNPTGCTYGITQELDVYRNLSKYDNSRDGVYSFIYNALVKANGDAYRLRGHLLCTDCNTIMAWRSAAYLRKARPEADVSYSKVVSTVKSFERAMHSGRDKEFDLKEHITEWDDRMADRRKSAVTTNVSRGDRNKRIARSLRYLGHTTKAIARRLKLEIDTIQKYVKGIACRVLIVKGFSSNPYDHYLLPLPATALLASDYGVAEARASPT